MRILFSQQAIHRIFELDKMIDQYRTSDSKEEMIQLARAMTERHHEHASFSPGYYQGFFRLGYWRWIKYPDSFNYKHARGSGELFVHWIDTKLKEETLAARKAGEKFETQFLVFDQFKN